MPGHPSQAPNIGDHLLDLVVLQNGRAPADDRVGRLLICEGED
jgi:hypothetical protein